MRTKVFNSRYKRKKCLTQLTKNKNIQQTSIKVFKILHLITYYYN